LKKHLMDKGLSVLGSGIVELMTRMACLS
jgi:hypothetical protein